MGIDGFFYGTLCHPALLALVLGRAVQMQPAVLPGFAVAWAQGRVFPVITPGAGQAGGVLVRDLSADDWARLDFYEAGFAFTRMELHRVEATVTPSNVGSLQVLRKMGFKKEKSRVCRCNADYK